MASYWKFYINDRFIASDTSLSNIIEYIKSTYLTKNFYEDFVEDTLNETFYTASISEYYKKKKNWEKAYLFLEEVPPSLIINNVKSLNIKYYYGHYDKDTILISVPSKIGNNEFETTLDIIIKRKYKNYKIKLVVNIHSLDNEDNIIDLIEKDLSLNSKKSNIKKYVFRFIDNFERNNDMDVTLNG